MKKWLLLILSLLVYSLSAQQNKRAETLAKQYCGSCHSFPNPELLPRAIWTDNVLPNMGQRLGVKTIKQDYLVEKSAEEKRILEYMNIYSKVQLISDEDWALIVKFYSENSPVEPLPQAPKAKPQKMSRFFASKMTLDGDPVPKTTMLFANEKSGELFFGEAKNQLFVKDSSNTLFSLPEVNSPPVDMVQRDKGIFNILCIGNINPSDLSLGRIYQMDLQKGEWSILIDSLARPVDMLWANFDQDGEKDLLISNYGNNVGGLTLYKGGKANNKIDIIERSGARKVEVFDFDGNGFLDIVTMFCQGNEGISIFYNLGNGAFREEPVLEFHPLMGLSYFQLVDFNSDGKPDILLSNGDNWDYSNVRKNYHGVRIFMNKGDNTFEQTWFYPQYGVSKSLAVDFDQDGDLDIVSIAFYNELDDPAESFLYFENQGNFKFQPYFINDAKNGKWLTLDIGDLDQDGDVDIFLGSYFHNTTEFANFIASGSAEYPQVLILSNNLKP